jgi:ubiquinone biosynthesis protein COQ9
MNQEQKRQKVFAAMLRHAAFDGWTDASLARSCKDNGVSDVKKLFPAGLQDATRMFFDHVDDQMCRAMRRDIRPSDRVRDKIASGVRARIGALAPYRAVLPQLARAVSPRDGLFRLWHAADLIWWEAGDASTDYNHYSKRILLSGVIASTTLYWMNDAATDFEKTEAFLQNRISDVLKAGGFLAKIKNKGNRAA